MTNRSKENDSSLHILDCTKESKTLQFGPRIRSHDNHRTARGVRPVNARQCIQKV